MDEYSLSPKEAIALSCSEIPNSSGTISRRAAIDAVYKCADIFVGDMPVMVVKADAYEALAQLPSAQPEQRLSCKNCVHLGHGYMMPCKNCKRNQMLPDWYEVETERKKND